MKAAYGGTTNARHDSGSNASTVEPHAQARSTLSFDRIYEEHFAFVFRTARRLGVSESSIDDAVQEVFLVVHRQLPKFEGRSTLKTWLFQIARRVCADHRRASRRRGPHEPLQEMEIESTRGQPLDQLAHAEATARLHALLGRLDDTKREIFVLVELEQMSIPEAAEALGIGLNTAYSRLRLARRDFERALFRDRALSPSSEEPT